MKTAVDYAFEKLASQGLLITKDYKNLVAYKEAKAMFEDQIMEAFNDGVNDECIGGNKTPEQYYKETFKSE